MAAGRIVVSQYMPARNRSDRLVSGAKLYVYENGTTTLASIYADSALTTPLANPVVANSSGQFASIWADNANLYTVSVTGPNGESIGNPSVYDDYSPSIDWLAAEAAEDARDDAQAAAALTVNATGVLNFDTYAELVADTTLSYTAGTNKVVVTAGNTVRAEEVRYTVLSSGASSADVTTAGGVKMDVASAEILKTGPVSEPNNVVNPSTINKIASWATASHIQGGTTGLPNFIGWEADIQFQTGDGGSSYSFTVPFVVPDESWSVSLNLIRLSDRQLSSLVATITGKGTTNISITTSSPVASTHEIMAQFFGSQEIAEGSGDGNPRLAFILSGYDNLSNELMTVVNGAHNCNYGGNHNTFVGGSNNLVLFGSYGTLGGFNCHAGRQSATITTTSGFCAIGQNLRVDGRGAAALGFGNLVQGNGSASVGETNSIVGISGFASGSSHELTGTGLFAAGINQTLTCNYSGAIGLDNTVTTDYTFACGRNNSYTSGGYGRVSGQENASTFAYAALDGNKAVARNYNTAVRGYSGTVAGSRQDSTAYVAGQSTSTTPVTLTKSGGSTINVVPDGATRVRGEIVCVDKNNADCCSFTIDALVLLAADSTSTLVSGGTPTLTHNTAGFASVTAAVTAATGGYRVSVTGLAGITMNCYATLRHAELGRGAQ